MCGIAGYFVPNVPEPAATMGRRLHAMAGRLVHRGPDGGGVWMDASAGIGLTHRRLAILDRGPAGHQPMASADGRLTLVYNGELYNAPALATELRRAGTVFRGHSDTEILLEAIARWGLEPTLRRAAGMFALALWDGRRLRLARDRFGIKPLVWTPLPGGGVAFASDLDGLRGHDGWRPRLDRDSLASYLRFSYVPAPATLLAGVRKLMPGHVLEIGANGQPGEEQPFWSLAQVVADGAAAPFSSSLDQAADALEALLDRVIGEHTAADVPVGAFLSGGVDSSLVVALLRRHLGKALPTFTIGFAEADHDESAFAAQVAGHLGTEHHCARLDAAQALAMLPSLFDRVDEPLADSSLLPTALVAALARPQVSVVLTGDGGDEIFGGYGRYGRTIGLEYMAGTHGPAIYRRQVSAWPEPDAIVIGGHERHGLLWDTSLAPAFADKISRLQYTDSLTYLPDDILTKVDRATMAVSLEARVPLLDHRVAEAAWQLPAPLRHGGKASKRILRHLLARHLPSALVDRPKMGFGVPVAAWLRGPWQDWAQALLAPDRLRAQGLLQAEAVQNCWHDLLAARPATTEPIWCILALQVWLERHGAGLDLG